LSTISFFTTSFCLSLKSFVAQIKLRAETGLTFTEFFTTRILIRSDHWCCLKQLVFNNLMTQIGNGQGCVNSSENVFQTCETSALSTVKTRLIQVLIQIEWPMHWNRYKLLDITQDLINVERYNAFESKFKLKWNYLQEVQVLSLRTLFDNWNQRKVVRQPSKVLMFGLDYVWREAAIIEHEINHI
jgi:hypothetical protein